jgi:hypothetical protein
MAPAPTAIIARDGPVAACVRVSTMSCTTDLGATRFITSDPTACTSASKARQNQDAMTTPMDEWRRPGEHSSVDVIPTKTVP